MPAYNAAKYIRQAIDSVLAQTVADWRLIVVNDCSTDDTAAIAREYASRDARIACVDTPAQSGSVLAPRTLGVTLAATQYVSPLDADDYIPADYLAMLLSCMAVRKADLVFPTMYTVNQDGDRARRLVPPPDSQLYDHALRGRDCVRLTLDGWLMGCNGGLIERALYLKAYAELPKYIGSAYTDEVLTRYILFSAEKVVASQVAYYYRTNAESITHGVSPRVFDFCYNNLALITFCRDRYGVQSDEYVLAQRQNFHWVFGAMRMLNTGRYSRADRRTAMQIIRHAIDNVDFGFIKPHVSPRYYMLLRSRRFLPVRRVLRLLDKFLGT